MKQDLKQLMLYAKRHGYDARIEKDHIVATNGNGSIRTSSMATLKKLRKVFGIEEKEVTQKDFLKIDHFYDYNETQRILEKMEDIENHRGWEVCAKCEHRPIRGVCKYSDCTVKSTDWFIPKAL